METIKRRWRKWLSPNPPKSDDWNNQINAILPGEKRIFQHRECPHKFSKLWVSPVNVTRIGTYSYYTEVIQ